MLSEGGGGMYIGFMGKLFIEMCENRFCVGEVDDMKNSKCISEYVERDAERRG